MNEIFIDVGHTESRVAVMENGKLVEIHIEAQNKGKLAGNIYKGIVENVLPGMQAAFINIGLEKNAFLYIRDAVAFNYNEDKSSSGISINSILKPGDEIIVQVSKEASGSKGARVTTRAAIPGRYIVLMPDTDYIGVSRRIENEFERDRLRDIIAKIKPEKMGVIVRTEAEGKEKDDFIEDIKFQTALWDRIMDEAKKSGAPKLIHKDIDLAYRAVRDLLNRDTARLVINDSETYRNALEIVSLFSADKKDIVEYYDGNINIMDFHGIESSIEKALSREIPLKSGGYIVIDQTEALTVIDVNTGKYTGFSSLEDTVLFTNIEACGEIARQLRLRDIGGIIIIDFIDMHSEANRNRVIEELKNELKKDRTKSSVFGITQLGFVEMTRKKAGRRLSAVMQKTCPLCAGSGRIKDEDTIVRGIERKVERIFRETDIPAVLVEVSEAVNQYLIEHDMAPVRNLEKLYGRRIIVKSFRSMGYNDVDYKYLSSEAEVKNAMNPFDMGSRVKVSVNKVRTLNISGSKTELEGVVEQVIYSKSEDKCRLVIDVNTYNLTE